MDISKFKRNASKVKASLVTAKDASVITKAKCKVYVPKRFADKQLLIIGNSIRTVGILAIVLEDGSYGVLNVNASIEIRPSNINTVTIDETDYYEFGFQSGETLFGSLNLVKDDGLVYLIYDEIVSRGNTPWYMEYKDLGNLFDTALKYGGLNLNTDHAILEMMTATRARQTKDLTKYYRHQLTSRDSVQKVKSSYIALRSVMYGATNTTAKLMGAYLNEGLTSALVSPASREEHLENILRR